MLTALGAVRLGVGASLLVAPRLAGRIWVGDDAHGHGTKVFARALGARDVALGAAIVTSQRDEDRAARLVQLGIGADIADAAATVIAWRNLEGHRRWAAPLVAFVVAALGARVWSMAETVVEEQPVSDANAAPSTEANGSSPVGDRNGVATR